VGDEGGQPARPGLRERKKERTRQELQRAALDLFATKGFDAVSTDDIAAAAEVSKTTFYRYFPSKEDVLLGTSAENLALVRRALADQPEGEGPVQAARNAFRELAERYQADREVKLLVHEVSKTTPSLAARSLEHQATWEEALREDFARRDPTASELRTRVLAAAVLGAVRAAIASWLAHDPSEPLPELVDDALRLLLDTDAPTDRTPAPRQTRGRRTP
jgi:AcrR family transcriptional regulator